MTTRTSHEWPLGWNSQAQSALKGFAYQHLYAIRMIADVLSGDYDEFGAERLEDWVAWRRRIPERRSVSPEPGRRPLERLLFVQNKLRTTKCYLKSSDV